MMSPTGQKLLCNVEKEIVRNSTVREMETTSLTANQLAVERAFDSLISMKDSCITLSHGWWRYFRILVNSLRNWNIHYFQGLYRLFIKVNFSIYVATNFVI
jgi:hypothetical protein